MGGMKTVRELRAILLAGAVIAAPGTVYAQVASGNDAALPKQDEIVVIGTRRTDRTLTNTASPVDVVSSAELQAQPTANLLDSLKNIIPSFFVGQNTISDASSFVRAPSLRGLPGDEVLVMLNGKRYNRSALVQVYTGGDTGLSFGSQGADISAIPSIAIKLAGAARRRDRAIWLRRDRRRAQLWLEGCVQGSRSRCALRPIL